MAKPLDGSAHLYLVDASSYIFRAYHALPPLTRKSDGLPVGAVSGFCNMLYKLVREPLDGGEHPTHMGIIFDASGDSFRNEIYPEYKANRSEPPEDLKPQFSLIREATSAFGFIPIELKGYEADDLIAAYATKAAEKGARVTIISSDKDLMQLLDGNISMYDTMKNKAIGIDEVVEKFGVTPEKMIDLQSLAGDSTDNIPGVPGIGPKTAAELIGTFGDLETLLSRLDEIKQPKRRETLMENADKARISKKLVALDRETPLPHPFEALEVYDFDGARLVAFLKAMEFTTLTRRVIEAYEVDADEVTADESLKAQKPDGASSGASSSSEADTPQKLAEHMLAKVAAKSFDVEAYETVTDMAALERWVAHATHEGYVAVDTETDGLDSSSCNLVGVSLALQGGRACYIPLAHGARPKDLLGGDKPKQIEINAALDALKPLLADPSVLKIGQNIKFDMAVLVRYGLEVAPIDDTMMLSYVLDAGRGGHGMDELSERHLNHTTIPFKEVAGSGKNQLTFDEVPLDQATRYAAEDADVTFRLWQVLKPRLVAEKMATVYETLDRPLAAVLARMEDRGICVDKARLSQLSSEFGQKIARLEDEIFEEVGQRFTIGSPKQLGEILFEKMGFKGGKKNKSGGYSTDVSVLEELVAEGHKLPELILEWRQLSKLKSTYTEALLGHINRETGRVHTSYSPALTTTGRLSSSDPNLQNIPVRSEEGRKIRSAFIAPEGHKLISADYSQIELRVLAHIADIEPLKEAFRRGEDIHAATASEMFGVPLDKVDGNLRRNAKTINFGIIYGISAFGLASRLGISRSDAANYIETYFERFPGIKAYMDETKERAHKQGFVTTLFGRKAHYPGINTKDPNRRGFYERAAINAPIQGSAADIIRRAMIRMEEALASDRLQAKMLLQVHDELIFEAPQDEVEATITLVKKVMGEAAEPTVQMSVPLVVDARAADNWDEAH